MTVCSNPLRSTPPAERIAVVRLGAFGDVTRTLPAVSNLRSLYPGARITWIVEPGSATVARLSPAIDEVLVFPRSDLTTLLRAGRLFGAASMARGFFGRLREARFDLVVDFHGLLRSGVITRLTGAPRRITFSRSAAREGAWVFATDRAEIGLARRSRYQRNAGLVEYLGGDPDATPIAIERAAGAADEGLVLLHPGTSPGTPYKRWPAERYAQLAVRIAEHTGRPCLVGAGPSADEASLARAIELASDGAAVRAPATPDASALVALFSRCALVVGSDTGPLHLAALSGTPVVQILGPTDPVENHPYPGTASRQVRVPTDCSPCRAGCLASSCMLAVPVAQVEAAARELLGGAAAGIAPPWRAA